MKTTIDVADRILVRARAIAQDRQMTLKEVVEKALLLFLQGEKRPRAEFRLRRHPFKGKGLVAGLEEGDWREIRSRIYEGRGG